MASYSRCEEPKDLASYSRAETADFAASQGNNPPPPTTFRERLAKKIPAAIRRLYRRVLPKEATPTREERAAADAEVLKRLGEPGPKPDKRSRKRDRKARLLGPSAPRRSTSSFEEAPAEEGEPEDHDSELDHLTPLNPHSSID
ncbi:MAG: hypothetical protein Q9183_002632 [Haloplaca sp. 2 TL-2023]